MDLDPHEFWQRIDPPGHSAEAPPDGFAHSFPARLPDGRQLRLPIRVLPGAGTRAVASLILNQASFAVEDALADILAEKLRPLAPEVIVAVPTLGLPLANAVARRLGHTRLVALGTSRKFWYDEALSEPMSSITSPLAGKRIYLDPRMLPICEKRRVAVIDDVISTGSSMVAVLRLLERAGIAPVAVAAAMLQGESWRAPLAPFADRIIGAFSSPLLERTAEGRWVPKS